MPTIETRTRNHTINICNGSWYQDKDLRRKKWKKKSLEKICRKKIITTSKEHTQEMIYYLNEYEELEPWIIDHIWTTIIEFLKINRRRPHHLFDKYRSESNPDRLWHLCHLSFFEFHEACKVNDPSFKYVKILLEMDFRISFEQVNYAFENSRWDLLKFLFENGAYLSHLGFEKIKFLVDNEIIDLQHVDEKNGNNLFLNLIAKTVLIREESELSILERNKTLRYLHSKCPEIINSKNKRGQNALMLALTCYKNHFQTQNGCTVWETCWLYTNYGPFENSINKPVCRYEIVELLVELGIELKVTKESGNYILSLLKLYPEEDEVDEYDQLHLPHRYGGRCKSCEVNMIKLIRLFHSKNPELIHSKDENGNPLVVSFILMLNDQNHRSFFNQDLRDSPNETFVERT